MEHPCLMLAGPGSELPYGIAAMPGKHVHIGICTERPPSGLMDVPSLAASLFSSAGAADAALRTAMFQYFPHSAPTGCSMPSFFSLIAQMLYGTGRRNDHVRFCAYRLFSPDVD
ncbi:MAG: hypothetical protein ACI4O7_13785 [Aristaeellaceae bacterium]